MATLPQVTLPQVISLLTGRPFTSWSDGDDDAKSLHDVTRRIYQPARDQPIDHTELTKKLQDAGRR
jgi:hypothetical protein